MPLHCFFLQDARKQRNESYYTWVMENRMEFNRYRRDLVLSHRATNFLHSRMHLTYMQRILCIATNQMSDNTRPNRGRQRRRIGGRNASTPRATLRVHERVQGAYNQLRITLSSSLRRARGQANPCVTSDICASEFPMQSTNAEEHSATETLNLCCPQARRKDSERLI